MSIQSEINRIIADIADSYEEISAKGGTLPADQNSDNLEEAIRSIQGGAAVEPKTITAEGTYNPPSGVDGFNPVVVAVPYYDGKFAFDVVAKPNVASKGSVSGSGEYVEGSQATVVASPVSPAYFENWTVDGDVVSSSPSYSFEVDDDVEIVGNFLTPSANVTQTVSGTARTTVTYNGTNYNSNFTAYVGDTISFKATASSSSHPANIYLNGSLVNSGTNATYDLVIGNNVRTISISRSDDSTTESKTTYNYSTINIYTS